MSEIEEFRNDRNAALQDVSKLEAFCKKWKIQMPTNPESVRRAILKARTACTDLPRDIRREAREKLQEVGSTSFDDGDLEALADDANREMGLPEGEDWGHK